MKNLIIINCLIFINLSLFSQISLTSSTFSANFDSYEGSTATLPIGVLSTSANYRGINNGSNNSGGAYSYSTISGENSLGGLRSGSNSTIIYEILFINNTGGIITDLQIDYDFEQYRYLNASGWAVTGGGAISTEDLSLLNQNGNSSGTNGTVEVTPKSLTLTGISISDGSSFSIIFTYIDDSGSDNGIAIDNLNLNATVLPIKLSHIQATNQNTTNTLQWQTASEINNSHFEIQHSMDGRNYQTIGKEMGKGNTTDNVDYSYAHENVKAGTHYYQLKQVDYDGQSETFGPVSVSVKGESIRFYPTTANNMIHFEGQLDGHTYEIYNTSGSLIQFGNITNDVIISEIPQGIYYIKYADKVEQLSIF